MDNKNISNSDRLKNSLCYLPFGGAILFFVEESKSKTLIKHIKYWTFLFIAFILIRLVVVSVLFLPLGWMLFIIYAWISWFFWYKAYNWEDFEISYINEFEEKVKNNLNWEEKKYNDNDKKDKEKDKEKNKDDVLDF